MVVAFFVWLINKIKSGIENCSLKRMKKQIEKHIIKNNLDTKVK